MKNKPVCNRSSVTHASSAHSKYFMRVALCLISVVAIISISQIVMPEWRLAWAITWVPILSYFVWRYWIRLRIGGYFECDSCWKLKHARHAKVFHDSTSGLTHVWCDRCLKSMRQSARSMRNIRAVIAGMVRHDRSTRPHRVVSGYVKDQSPTPAMQSSLPRVVIVPRKPMEPEIQVSDPKFKTPGFANHS